jgi:Holliday junction resolvase RusA-like endonuclease
MTTKSQRQWAAALVRSATRSAGNPRPRGRVISLPTISKQRPATSCVELYLPTPPSANRMWAFGRKRVFKSDEYKSWIETATSQLNSQYPGTILGPYKLTIQLRVGPKIDLDNAVKPTNDLLQSAGVIENDKHCRQVSLRWVTSGFDGMYVRVERAAIE